MNETDNNGAATPAFLEILEFLKTNRGFDFSGYKRTSLERRVQRRMSAVHVKTFEAYLDYLKAHVREFELLFNTIQINITSFFRDKPAWDYLAAEVLPRLVSNLQADESLRVWSAGCASGEEPYSIVMLLAELIGAEACREKVKIYATDVDETALTQARAAIYDSEKVKLVPEPMLEKYFEHSNGHYVFRNDMRRILVFGNHDLMQDAPISRLDLLVCRNTLIYFNREAQKRIITNFHFALRDSGFLFLGKAEMLLTHGDLFTPTQIKHRIFTKVLPNNIRRHPLAVATIPEAQMGDRKSDFSLMQEAAFENLPSAQLVVNAEGNLKMVNGLACQTFGLDQRDLGRPFRDLEISYRPVELRSLIQKAHDENHSVTIDDTERALPDGTIQHFNVKVSPVLAQGNRWLGTQITFSDISEKRRLEGELEQSRHEVETAYEELQSTNEELETSNEELQSTVEELQTTNEELQSTNEEMETVNEELQSTNAELQTTNDELRQRTTDVDQASAFLESILDSVNVGVVVVGRNYDVLMWNRAAEELWGLRMAEVRGQSLLDLDFGLPVEELKKPIHDFWSVDPADIKNREKTLILNAVNRRGKAIMVKVTPAMQMGISGAPIGVVLLMETQSH